MKRSQRRTTQCIPSNVFFILSLLILAIQSPIPCLANSYVINPSDDGSIDIYGHVFTSDYFLCSNDSRGIVEFPLDSINGQITTAILSVNPYALPLSESTVQVYGYSSTDGLLTISDYDAGAFLGNWTLPDLNFGQDTYFNVTSFMKTVTTPYVGFNLRSDDVDIFSSLEYNYGHPSQLSVSTTIPEPATLMLLTLGGLTVLRKKK
jgi:hypothetical protein